MIRDRLAAPEIERHDLFNSLLYANNEDSDGIKLTETELISKFPEVPEAPDNQHPLRQYIHFSCSWS